MNRQTDRQVEDHNVCTSWWRDLDDRAPDDGSVGPARRVEVAVRCRACWGQGEARIVADELSFELSCRVCDRRVGGRPAGDEWQRMMREADRDMAGARVGRPQEFAGDAKFVLKLLPEMDRDRVKFEERVEKATRDAVQRSKRDKLTRLDFEERGTPGFLYLQACAFVAGLNAAPRDISLARPPDALQELLGDDALSQSITPGGNWKSRSPRPTRAERSRRCCAEWAVRQLPYGDAEPDRCQGQSGEDGEAGGMVVDDQLRQRLGRSPRRA